MNIISKKKQGVIAIICAIAMIVTSLTIYNPREAKADTSVAVDGKQYSVTVRLGQDLFVREFLRVQEFTLHGELV